MEEITRGEAIKRLNCHLYSCDCECDGCPYDAEVSNDKAIRKAISDMEKLEKIERILEESEGWHDDTCHALNRIEQIVKEVE